MTEITNQFKANNRLESETFKSSRWRIPELALFSTALLSLIYALVTAPGRGFDLTWFQIGARDWVDGVFQIGAGPIGEYPPFALPLVSPLAFFSRESLTAPWLMLNIAATALVLYFADELWASEWPVKARLYLGVFLVASAPFRVTVRNGQISLMVLALLLAALLARKQQRAFLAGALLGLSLCKYSLTFPFFVYFVWKREWKTVSAAILIPLALTQVFAWRTGLSLIEVAGQYAGAMSKLYMSGASADMGTTEVKLLFFALTGERESLTAILTIAVSLGALICMWVVFARRPRFEMEHLAALALFSLWAVYHRTYDSVLCLLPAALMIDSLVKRRFVAFSRFWLAGLALLVVSVPGLLTERFGISSTAISSNILLMLGVHAERLLVFGMFWSILFLMWKTGECAAESEPSHVNGETTAPLTLAPESQHL